ncbi:MAG: hypothetical protein V4645_10185 [Pseudomonadota bacterium]
MTAIPAPSANLLDMFFVQTGMLVREAKKSSVALVFSGPTGGYFQHVAAKARFMLSVLNAVHVMKNSVESVENSAKWFNDFVTGFDDSEEAIGDRLEKVLARVDECQASLKTLRATIQSAIPNLSKSAISHKMKSSRVEVAHRLEKAVVANFEALENVRWMLLERQADSDIAAGKVSEAYSFVEDLFASLKR